MKRAVLSVLLAVCTASAASAWWPRAHSLITHAAVDATPEVPAFFKEGAGFIAHVTTDPDLGRNRGTPLASALEHGEHYLDVELLKGRELPEKRYDYLRLLNEIDVKAEHVGIVPYAVGEWTERLAIAFAEHRKWPDNPYIRSKCLVYAGYLSHYAQDMTQPLHLTVHFNGRKQADGTVEQKGIHEKVDSLPLTLEMTAREMAEGLTIEPADSLMEAVIGHLKAGFALVDHVYEIGPKIPRNGEDAGEVDPLVVAFAKDRTREAARFTSALYLTAWRRSAELELPGWLDRGAEAEGRE